MRPAAAPTSWRHLRGPSCMEQRARRLNRPQEVRVADGPDLDDVDRPAEEVLERFEQPEVAIGASGRIGVELDEKIEIAGLRVEGACRSGSEELELPNPEALADRL